MKNIFRSIINLFAKKPKNQVQVLAAKKIKENMAALQSLKEYDEGKKTISTSAVDRYMSRV